MLFLHAYKSKKTGEEGYRHDRCPRKKHGIGMGQGMVRKESFFKNKNKNTLKINMKIC